MRGCQLTRVGITLLFELGESLDLLLDLLSELSEVVNKPRLNLERSGLDVGLNQVATVVE